jgi:hypothetical protein
VRTEDWNRLYLKHQVYLHGIKSLELQMVKTGAGKTGARYAITYRQLIAVRATH